LTLATVAVTNAVGERRKKRLGGGGGAAGSK